MNTTKKILIGITLLGLTPYLFGSHYTLSSLKQQRVGIKHPEYNACL